ncbi:MAG: glycosyltransferase family 4 protein [Gulosibacter sp.]|uniref:glycosyltransferase family 4 protein n=1 Tax=Gulosibacter sp. TaxID=2817531 RepID=UPI003F92B522
MTVIERTTQPVPALPTHPTSHSGPVPFTHVSDREAAAGGAATASKRILIVSQYLWPEAQTLPDDLARELTARGHRVRIITGFPNYPEGKIHAGYRQRWRMMERRQGSRVLRVPLVIDHSQSRLRRTLNYATFAVSAASARGFAQGADVVYVYAPQMTPAFGPWLWRMLGGAPYVLHVQDLWPDSIVGSSMVGGGRVGNAIAAALAPWLHRVYSQAAGVVAIAPTMVRMLRERGVPAERTHLVYNWAEIEPDANASDSAGPSAVVPHKDARSRFIFGGNTGEMQDLETLVRAAHACRKDDLEVLIVGDGVALPRIRQLAAELGAANVKFTGQVSSEDMPYFYQSSDFGLVTLKDLPIFHGTIPSKLQAVLAAGLPVVSTVRGDVRSIVADNRIGFVAEPEDPESLANALRQAASLTDSERAALADRARTTYREQFTIASAVDKMERILVTAAAQKPSSIARKWSKS